jgi:hypothetical protein
MIHKKLNGSKTALSHILILTNYLNQKDNTI